MMRFYPNRKVLLGLVLAVVVCSSLLAVALVTVPLPLAKLHAPQAYRFYDRHGELLQVIIADDDYFRLSVEVDELPQLFIDTLLLQEDQYFYRHPGVNPLAVARAMLANVTSGQVVSGASTITMQLARMLERRPRTISAKLIEMFRAIQLEMRYSKREILQSYLSIAPYGGNLEGVNAATYGYFGKPARQLSAAQIALLVALPKSPNQYRPDRHPLRAIERRDELLARMLTAGLIDEAVYQRSIAEPVPKQRLVFPARIPHLAWYLKSQHPQTTDFHTSIDLNMQLRAEHIVQQYVGSLHDQGIHNAAVVVLDTASHEVRAMVGSADYFDIANQGANNGAVALRSPGSTLKPFLYGLAMDAGLIAEKTMLEDIPLSVAGYSPRNYDKIFRGQVTVRDALIDSLNVVAVRLSQQLGIDKLHGLLRQGGISSLDQPADYYGLPLVLGGVEVSLLELTNLYASMANYGEYRRYRLETDQPWDADIPVRLLSPEASWLVSDILTDVERPDFPSTWQYSSSRPTVAWKTGTSYGNQDAWSVGFHPELTIGVWVGNFDGSSASQLSGSTTAAPLFFDLMQALIHEPTRWFAKPSGIGERQVCDLCGLPGNVYCPNQTHEQYIPAAKGPATLATCQVRQKVFVEGREQIVDVWPSELAAFFHHHGVPVTQVPGYDVQHMAGERYFPPVIQSPVAGAIYVRRPDLLNDEDQRIKLQVATTNRVKRVQWYLNDKMIADSDQPYEPLFISLAAGGYVVTVVDDIGGRDSVSLEVRDYRQLVGVQ
ncbi:penicillin-binding protein 1C [Gynuella sunshinyii]|uniref:peptidoglycan glycosyltransferase n=1 Tax=Gynuella sunshinyii YC6258 TaxID=1445510 RepID=A0A0C5VQX9_9GAMM|nr:penicillin-binding protein 1C [Gynuella sunshinyii]AJQ97027.1 membrane carboxypeptidase/penicillin-binding protein PbpC [Gynuella sunshinyii YC6258]